jgi:hypothetical protein
MTWITWLKKIKYPLAAPFVDGFAVSFGCSRMCHRWPLAGSPTAAGLWTAAACSPTTCLSPHLAGPGESCETSKWLVWNNGWFFSPGIVLCCPCLNWNVVEVKLLMSNCPGLFDTITKIAWHFQSLESGEHSFILVLHSLGLRPSTFKFDNWDIDFQVLNLDYRREKIQCVPLLVGFECLIILLAFFTNACVCLLPNWSNALLMTKSIPFITYASNIWYYDLI